MSEAKKLLQQYCRENNHLAFQTFYRSQADRLWRFLRLRGCAEQDAYDFLAESFLKFIQVVCKDFRSPVALLYRIAINLHIDHYRRQQSSPFDYEAEQARQAIIVDSEQEYVRELIKKLSESEQNLLLMRYWIGLKHKEIAQELKIPEGTVRRQCAEALKKLRQLWEIENQ